MAHASVILLWIAYLLYAGAFALFVVQFLTKSPALNRIGMVVAAAYAIILAVLVIYYFMSARRVNALKRDMELLEREVQRRQPAAGESGD